MAIRISPIVPAAFKALSFVSPTLAGRIAFTLFCRPVHPRRVNKLQRAMQTEGTHLLAKAKFESIPFISRESGRTGTLGTYTFEPECVEARQTTLLLHGWSSRATHLLAFVRPLTDRGHRVIAVDFPAHGLSSGRSFHLPMAVDALHSVYKSLPGWNNIIAHSLGGAVATSLVSGAISGFAPVPVERLVLISSPSSMRKIFAEFANMIGLNSAAKRALEANVYRLAGHPLEKFNGGELLRHPEIDTLVLHDPNDQEVPFEEAYEFLKAGPHVQLQAITDVGHRRILHTPEAVSLAADFCHGTT